MTAMVAHIHALLDRAQKSASALAFVVLIPKWTKVQAWATLSRSRWARHAGFSIEADAHGFLDGAQHQSDTKYRPSSFDSSVFFLQTDAGAARWPVTPALLARFRTALAKAIPSAGCRSIQEWEQKVKPLSAASPPSGDPATAGEDDEAARAARNVKLRSIWSSMSDAEKTPYNGSFRKYRKEALATMMTEARAELR